MKTTAFKDATGRRWTFDLSRDAIRANAHGDGAKLGLARLVTDSPDPGAELLRLFWNPRMLASACEYCATADDGTPAGPDLAAWVMRATPEETAKVVKALANAMSTANHMNPAAVAQIQDAAGLGRRGFGESIVDQIAEAFEDE